MSTSLFSYNRDIYKTIIFLWQRSSKNLFKSYGSTANLPCVEGVAGLSIFFKSASTSLGLFTGTTFDQNLNNFMNILYNIL